MCRLMLRRLLKTQRAGIQTRHEISELIVLGDDRAKVWEAQNEIKHQQHDHQSQGDHGLPVGIGERVNQLTTRCSAALLERCLRLDN